MYPTHRNGVDPFASFRTLTDLQASGLAGLQLSSTHETVVLADEAAEAQYAAHHQQQDTFCTGCGDRTEGFTLAGKLIELCPACAEHESARVLGARQTA